LSPGSEKDGSASTRWRRTVSGERSFSTGWRWPL
jgi:hypothetical protein